jgi:hypothetical protein
MPRDGTIVFVTGRLESGDREKEIRIEVRNGSSLIRSQTISFAPGTGATDAQILDTDFDLDFSAGDFLTVQLLDDGTSSSIIEHTILFWVKWRP